MAPTPPLLYLDVLCHRATVEAHKSSHKLPSVNVTIANNEVDFIIR